ncbi:TetR/AcrR family transcriptional regulator [Tomitella fengzijianii]|uniref:TetR/AcrR family transcriptional regulator n=1 Tax=Tomitella fengzijianii TaxID=2597660 RepID=A0A516WZ45_9ACTN|nr:TetR/AcrR family transcriptional regulator [Tomitella fengzijianii]QDQ96109.1 TetR/AcrR family transcriptional regulator [Tomitella fengzijianii]
MPKPDTREALIDAAERLVAARGLRGISVREVIRAAGQRNHGAIAYYFGSWHGLLAAVWAARSTGAEQQRQLRIAAEESDDRLHGLVIAYVSPFVAEVSRHTPSYWAQFNEQWLAGIHADFVNTPEPLVPGDPDYPPIRGMEAMQSIYADIAAELGHLAQPLRTARVALAARFVVSALASWERDQVSGVWQSLDDYEGELCRLMLALLRADGEAAAT